MHLAPGTLVDQRYEVHAVLGTGGQAVVYRVRHCQLGTWHAMKVVTRAHGEALERIVREGQLQASLRHPHVVRVTDVVTANRAPALIMDFVDGPDLAQVLETQSLPLEQVDAIGQAILSAVGMAHAQGLVHRDLKPENILLAKDSDGRVVPMVTDFGIAVHLTVDRRTPTGALMGTPYYMSPEQIRDGKRIDARSDVWALGAVLYELASRQVAFGGTNVLDIWTAVEDASPTPLRELVPDIPDRVATAIEGALKRDPNDRWQSCDEMLDVWSGTPIRSSTLRLTLDLDWKPWHGHDPITGEPTEDRIAIPTMAPGVATGWAPVVLAGFSGAAGLLLIGSALGALALFGLGAALERSSDGDPLAPATAESRPAQVERPAPGAPSVLATEPGSPVRIESTGPAPAAPSPSVATAEPVQPVEAPSEPASADRPRRLPRGRVVADGATVSLVRDGTTYTVPGRVPAGEYEVRVDFGSGPFAYPRPLEVGAGTTAMVVCNAGTQLCTYRETQP